MKAWLRNSIFIIIIIAVGLFGFYQLWLYPKYTVPILMYHYMGGDRGSLTVSPESFERQMKYLRDHDYQVISLDEFVEGKMAGKDFPHNTVVITFDDGIEDNYTEAFPILKKYQIPATIFVITGLVGKTYDGLDCLNWRQIKEMSAHGISFGSHSHTHRYLPNLSPDELIKEIEFSKFELEKQLGGTARHFCYPIGAFTHQVKKALKEAGYISASTTNRGFDRYNNDLYELQRIKIKDTDAIKPFHFWGKLTGYYNIFREAQPGS